MYIQEIENYRKHGSSDEWFVNNLIKRSSANMSTQKAFEEIDKVVLIAINEQEWDMFLHHFQYINTLARIANTTELSPTMSEHIEAILAKISLFNLTKHSDIKSFCSWFRLRI